MSTRADRRATVRNMFAEGATLLETPPLAGARSLPLDRVDPNPAQSRQVFDEQALDELAASIREHGILEPILVRPLGDRWQVVAGERRVRAARLAGLEMIPAIIREDLTDAQAAYITAVENLQREDLDIEDEARQYQALIELTGLSGRKLAERLGLQPNYVNRRLALLPYPYLLEKLRTGELTIKQALAHVAALNKLHGTPEYEADPENVRLGASTLTVDSEPEPEREQVDRTELDSRPPPQATPTPVEPGDQPALNLVPYRRRQIDQFMTWVGRVDRRGVPAKERQELQRQLAELQAWLARWQEELRED